jgi:hypothetical protein
MNALSYRRAPYVPAGSATSSDDDPGNRIKISNALRNPNAGPQTPSLSVLLGSPRLNPLR